MVEHYLLKRRCIFNALLILSVTWTYLNNAGRINEHINCQRRHYPAQHFARLVSQQCERACLGLLSRSKCEARAELKALHTVCHCEHCVFKLEILLIKATHQSIMAHGSNEICGFLQHSRALGLLSCENLKTSDYSCANLLFALGSNFRGNFAPLWKWNDSSKCEAAYDV